MALHMSKQGLDGRDNSDIEQAPVITHVQLNDDMETRSQVFNEEKSWTGSPADRLKAQRARPDRRLAYLDGLRGFAALLVYMLHYQGFVRDPKQLRSLESAFGDESVYYFAAFPFIRLFFTGGHFAVTTFFVISGYVLSYSPLKAIHAKESVKLLDMVGSALFRRWFRLFLPVFVTTFLWMASWHLLGIKSLHVAEKNLWDEMWKWYCDMKNSSFVFTDNHFNQYNFHTWSIPYEFRGSIVVWMTAIALRRLETNKRLLCEAALAWYFLYVVDGWYCALFVMGMLLCDLDLLAEKDELPQLIEYLKPLASWIFPVLMMVSLWFGGVPSVNADITFLRQSPGWYWMSFLKPQAVFDFRWFYRFIAATLAMIAIPRVHLVKSFFETRFCQYLGRISYGFYLIHGPILWSLGDRVYAASGRVRDHHITTSPTWINFMPLPGSGPLGLEVNHLAPQLILLPFTLWAGEVVTTYVDEPSVRFSQWLFRTLLKHEGN